MHPSTDQVWFKAECARATDFPQLVEIALSELSKFPEDTGAGIVCGPITTGGLGSIEANLEVFNLVIRSLIREGKPIFNQIPYEAQLNLFRDQWRAEDPLAREDAYFEQILTDFYAPLFDSGHILRAWFMPGWESSREALWEHEILLRSGVWVVHLVDADVKWCERP